MAQSIFRLGRSGTPEDPVVVDTGPATPKGDFQATSTTTATLLSALVAGGIPAGASYVEFTPSADVRVTTDGVLVPSATVGRPIEAGTTVRYRGDLLKLKFYGAATIDGGFYS